MIKRSAVVAACLVLQGASAFQSAAVLTASKTTALNGLLGREEPDPNSYAEIRRRFRRDFYTHESWLKHRAKNRFIGTLIKLFDSVVVRQLIDEILLVGAIATSVCLYNNLCVTGWDDFYMVHHDPMVDFKLPLVALPIQPFNLSGAALSLLLGKFTSFCRKYRLENNLDSYNFIVFSFQDQHFLPALG